MPRASRLALFAAAVLPAAAPARAQDDVTVYSARADAVEVTIYPDDLALITETRTVTLPATPVLLVIEDVADTLLPQSVIVRDLERPLAGNRFDFNQLTPESLVRHSVGQQVTLVSTNPASGVVSRIDATIVAVGDRVIFETGDGIQALDCAGLPEGIEFHAVPDDLYTQPRLSVRFAGGAAGSRTFRVSYLAHGFEWNADYVAQLADDAESMRLSGWATVTNASSRSFVQSDLNLVAGKLNLRGADEGGSRTAEDYSGFAAAEDADTPNETLFHDCFATEDPALRRRVREPGNEFETVIVTGTRIRREEFGDYHLYRLPWKTDLEARQTKQLQFLQHDDVRIERFYRVSVFGTSYPGVDAVYLIEARQPGMRLVLAPPSIVIRADNTDAGGLGEPLPRGTVRVFERHGGRSVLAGEARIDDLPVGSPLDLEMARALDSAVDITFDVTEPGRDRTRLTADVLAINDKSVPIELEFRHVSEGFDAVLEIEAASRPYVREGRYFVWRFTLPPGSASLRYTLLETQLR